MFSSLFAPLRGMLRPHFSLSKTRLETRAILIVGLVNSRTVNLLHLASQFPGAALHASNYRRLQRFFQYVRLDGEAVAPLAMRILVPGRPAVLALDRTHWKLGGKDVNILVLALATRRFRVPLLWTVLDHSGNSSTDQRIALMHRYLALFGVSSIKMLLADREFIGAAWLEFLCNNNIPFAIRLRENMQLRLEDGGLHSFHTLMRKRTHRPGPDRLAEGYGAYAGKPAALCRQAPQDRREACHRHQYRQSRSCPQWVSKAMAHRVPVRRCQDPWVQYGRHPPHRSRQDRHAPRHRHSRVYVGLSVSHRSNGPTGTEA